MRKMWKRIGCTAMAILTATSVWQASVMEEVFNGTLSCNCGIAGEGEDN